VLLSHKHQNSRRALLLTEETTALIAAIKELSSPVSYLKTQHASTQVSNAGIATSSQEPLQPEHSCCFNEECNAPLHHTNHLPIQLNTIQLSEEKK